MKSNNIDPNTQIQSVTQLYQTVTNLLICLARQNYHTILILKRYITIIHFL